MTARPLSLFIYMHFREGNGNPPWKICLENLRDWVFVAVAFMGLHRVSWWWLKWLEAGSSSSKYLYYWKDFIFSLFNCTDLFPYWYESHWGISWTRGQLYEWGKGIQETGVKKEEEIPENAIRNDFHANITPSVPRRKWSTDANRFASHQKIENIYLEVGWILLLKRQPIPKKNFYQFWVYGHRISPWNVSTCRNYDDSFSKSFLISSGS